MTDAYTNQPNNQTAKQEAIRQTRTVWVGLITGLLFALIGIILFVEASGRFEDFIWGLAISITLSVISFTSAFLAGRGRASLAGTLLLVSILLISLTTPIIAHGQGVALGVLVAIIGIGISAATLPSKYSTRGNAASLLVAAAVIVSDQLLPDFGFPSQPIYTNIFALVTSTVFIIIIARQFNEFTLRAKLVIAFATVTIIPLVVLGAYNNYVSTQTLTRENRDQLTSLDNTVAERYDSFFIQEINVINSEAKQNALVDFLLLSPQGRANSKEKKKAENTLLSFQRKDPIFINSYAILDANGKNILDTSPNDQGRDESREAYFSEVIKTGAPYASSVRFIEDKEAGLYFSAPIKDPANQIIGILRVNYRAIILQNIALSIIPDDPGILVLLVDRNTYLRLAYTGNRSQVFKSYKKFSDLEVAAFQAKGALPSGTPKEVLVSTNEETTTGIDHIETTPFFNTFSSALNTQTVNKGQKLRTQNWVAIVRQSSTDSIKPVADQTHNMILLSLALAGSAVLLALGAAQILASPLVSLTKVAEQIASGDINARANINTLDEIGALATSFNRMTDELNQAVNSLETRVVERTTDLEIAQRLSEDRANELQAISEISKVLISEQKLETLLPLITRLVSERFGYYHTGIFLVDETGQYAILQAANSEGGRNMLNRGHRLKIGESGLVGYVAETGIPRIALDVGSDAVYFNNPDLPNTRSEMALPLSARGKTIGILDIQSEKPGAFTDNDMNTFSVLAGQISTALENARLFAQTQQALNEAQALYRQNLQEGWTSFSREESLVGYRHNMTGGKKISEPIETEEIRQVINRGDSLIFHPDGITGEATIVVPIKLRGQIIGSINIKAPSKGRQWNSDEVNLAEVISERLSIALENARLIQESQRQVIKEQTISEVTGKIGASINLKNVLQTAVEELGRAMPGSEVAIKIQSENNHGSK